MALGVERQSARMSKITNDGCLTRSGTGCFIASCTRMATVGVKGLMKVIFCVKVQKYYLLFSYDRVPVSA